jgi:16S rRNA (cytosine1402-N4)-methyltransferase
MHIPVLLSHVLEVFKEKRMDLLIDGTLGLGGHAEALLTEHPEIKQFVGIDQDLCALEKASERLASFNPQCIHGSFRILDQYTSEEADGILLDLGVSSMQLDQAERGFSFGKEGPLDMRMDRTNSLDARRIINTYPEHEIARILFEYGEVRGSRRLAKAIVEARKKRPFHTTKELSDFLTPLMGYHPKRLHPMTLVFQGLRIAVNDELRALSEGLAAAFRRLRVGGRLCVISFHSLEDRMVKNFFREKMHKKEACVLYKKPLIADKEEIDSNPRARSAKLRVLERTL